MREIDPSQLAANERGETQRILSGLASALRYEGLRESGLAVVAGWDRRAPHDPALPVVNEYQLRNGNERRYITEPPELGGAEIKAESLRLALKHPAGSEGSRSARPSMSLVRLAQLGWGSHRQGRRSATPAG